MSQVAKAMVVQCGFSKELGQVAWSQDSGQSFVGQQVGQPPNCSADTADKIDLEVKAIVEKAYRCPPNSTTLNKRAASRYFLCSFFLFVSSSLHWSESILSANSI